MYRVCLLITLLCLVASQVQSDTLTANQVQSDSIAANQVQSESIAEVNIPCDKLPSTEINFNHDTGRFTITVGRQTLSATSIRFRKLEESTNACAVELANFTFISEEPLASLEDE
ncbi:hypothetical protein [Umboniibacter marinipuniceus]|uniref:Uncharacterized protein n=1 Tax=Umboniibacter marinipuniceus TaxID=569599 RepID=A0A3M0ADI5_9GAMM|nr:hypothetical protein [Umboniibacter marinipuniceus]RMA82596.1 hypothetical protein DFR27_0547 [Umboniibacter marinipuniceus]